MDEKSFRQMTRKELRAYASANRIAINDQILDEFIKNRKANVNFGVASDSEAVRNERANAIIAEHIDITLWNYVIDTIHGPRPSVDITKYRNRELWPEWGSYLWTGISNGRPST